MSRVCEAILNFFNERFNKDRKKSLKGEEEDFFSFQTEHTRTRNWYLEKCEENQKRPVV